MDNNIYYSLILVISCSIVTVGTILDIRQYQTNASLEKSNDVSCYQCNTTIHGEICSNLTSYKFISSFEKKCKGDKRICMVKTYSYVTNIQNSSNTTRPHKMKMWSLERNCVNKCEDGCIVIGERTKLYACNACCHTSLCNTMNISSKLNEQRYLLSFFIFTFIVFIL